MGLKSDDFSYLARHAAPQMTTSTASTAASAR
jgi:hypothetical protein